MRPRFITFSVLLTMLVCAGCGPTAPAQTGVLLVRIYLSGGPASSAGGSVCQGTRCPGAGVVTVHDSAGKVVARERVHLRDHARFVLAQGVYEVSAHGCSVQRAVVRSGRTSSADSVCSIS